MSGLAQLATSICTTGALAARLVKRPARCATSILLFFSSALGAGCGTEPPKPVVPLAPADEWADLPKSSQWLHAVGDFSGPHKEECAEATKWVVGESECQASACEDAKELAKDWLSRCPKLVPGDVDKVKEVLVKYEERAGKQDVPCKAQLTPLLEGKCGEDRTCEGPAQKWVTRCAEPMGSPLAVHRLAVFVQRRVKDHDVELDTRGCGELRGEITAGLGCSDKFKCEDAVAKIDVYRSRCEDEGDRPTVALALAEMTILAAAERKVEPLLAMADDDTSAAIRAKLSPLVADGAGVVVSACGTRVSSFDGYLAARKECEAGGMIVFARAFKLSGGYEVRIGQVAPAEPTTFVARYPSLLLAGEREIADKERSAAFTADLAAAEKLAADPKTALDGARKLGDLLRSRGREIFRTEAMRAAITAKDAAFVAGFKEIGKAKAAAKGAKKELASIAVRGEAHAFADMDADGSVRFGAASWATLFDTATLLPQSHAAYLTALKPLLKKTAKDRPSEDVDADEARAFGTLADDCQTGAVNAKNAERALLECAFGQRTCDAPQIAGFEKALESSRGSAETAFVATSIFQMSAVGKANEFYKKIMVTAQCEPPPW